MAEAAEATKGLTAPYPAFQTLKTLVKPMKEHGPPSRIDRSVLTSFSGAVGGQVLTMLKFLKLTDDSGHPTTDLSKLITTYDTDQWRPALAEVVRKAYAPLFQLNLETATPNQFNEHFRKTYPAAEEVSRKSMTFFLSAAREADIKISPYIMKNKKPRLNGSPRRKVWTKEAKAERKAEQAAAAAAAAAAGAAARNNGGHDPRDQREKSPYDVLMNDIYDPAVMKADSPEEKAVFTLARFLRTREARA